MADRYREEVSKLVKTLNDDDGQRQEAIELIRALIDKVVLVPDPNSDGLLIDLHGDLAEILNMSLGPTNPKAGEAIDLHKIRLVTGRGSPVEGVQDKMVGPAGFEPAAFKL